MTILKWGLIGILTIFLPIVGIPWLLWELWQLHNQNSSDRFYKQLFKPVVGTNRQDFSSDEAYLNQVTEDLRAFENGWRSNSLFHRLTDSDFKILEFGDQYWTEEKYLKFCDEISREPIGELVEDWHQRQQNFEESCARWQTIYCEHALRLKEKVLEAQSQGESWMSVRDSIQEEAEEIGLKIWFEDGSWTISYEEQLAFHVSKAWLISHRPNHISFPSKIQTKSDFS